MKNQICRAALLAAVALVLSTPVFAADTPLSPVAQVLDREVKMIESEFISLAEAMPADKYAFAPTNGEFKGVRTFAQQVSHTGTVIYMVSAGLLGEKSPVEAGTNENGPANLTTKEDCVAFAKAAFAYAHKAIASLKDENVVQKVSTPYGEQSRLSLANMVTWHSFDHYGQMVVYARMNGIVPPASRPRQQ